MEKTRTVTDLNKFEGRIDDKGDTIQHPIYEVEIIETTTNKLERAKVDVQVEIDILEVRKSTIQDEINSLILTRDQMIGI